MSDSSPEGGSDREDIDDKSEESSSAILTLCGRWAFAGVLDLARGKWEGEEHFEVDGEAGSKKLRTRATMAQADPAYLPFLRARQCDRPNHIAINSDIMLQSYFLFTRLPVPSRERAMGSLSMPLSQLLASPHFVTTQLSPPHALSAKIPTNHLPPPGFCPANVSVSSQLALPRLTTNIIILAGE